MTRLLKRLAPYVLGLMAVAVLTAPAWAASAPPKKPIPRHTLNGTVAGLAPGHHALIKATKAYGRETHTSSTRGDGGYTLRGLTPGSYTVRPSHTRYHFVPSFRTVLVRVSDVEGVDFTAHPHPTRGR
jgi:hypothetical protein